MLHVRLLAESIVLSYTPFLSNAEQLYGAPPESVGGKPPLLKTPPLQKTHPSSPCVRARVRARILWRYSLEQLRKQFWVELFSLINPTTRVVHSFQGPHVGKVHYTSNLWSKRGHIE